jgi:hypothetical protein
MNLLPAPCWQGRVEKRDLAFSDLPTPSEPLSPHLRRGEGLGEGLHHPMLTARGSESGTLTLALPPVMRARVALARGITAPEKIDTPLARRGIHEVAVQRWLVPATQVDAKPEPFPLLAKEGARGRFVGATPLKSPLRKGGRRSQVLN